MTAREFVTPLLYDRFDPRLQEKVDCWYDYYCTPLPPWYRPVQRFWWHLYWKHSVPLLLQTRDNALREEIKFLRDALHITTGGSLPTR